MNNSNNNICFFIDSLSNSGGTERVTTVIANGLASHNFIVTIVTIQKFEKSFFKLNKNISVMCLRDTENKMSLWERVTVILKLRKIIKEKKIDILISVDSLLSIYSLPASFSYNVKNICWEQFNFKIDLNRYLRKMARQLSGILSDRIVVLSEKDKTFWDNGLVFNRAGVSVVYNPSSYSITELAYCAESRKVLCVGRLTKQKGFDLILNAWKEINNRHPDWILTIVGNGEEKENLINRAKELHIVECTEFVAATSNIQDMYSKSSIFCLPSRFEGFGLVGIEALSFGLPIVAYNCDCGPSEFVSSNGVLVQNGDVEALAESLISIMSDTQVRTSMSKNSKIAAEKFMLEKVIDNWLGLLQNIK